MGCVVNGPGEAKEADYGIAAGKGIGILFKKGEVVKKVSEENLLEELKKLIAEDLKNWKSIKLFLHLHSLICILVS